MTVTIMRELSRSLLLCMWHMHTVLILALCESALALSHEADQCEVPTLLSSSLPSFFLLQVVSCLIAWQQWCLWFVSNRFHPLRFLFVLNVSWSDLELPPLRDCEHGHTLTFFVLIDWLYQMQTFPTTLIVPNQSIIISKKKYIDWSLSAMRGRQTNGLLLLVPSPTSQPTSQSVT